MMDGIGEKGIVWFNDGSGQVHKARLVNYDPIQNTFWACTSRDCPPQVDVVVILKNGDTFPGGKAEWCGRTCVVGRERLPEAPEGFFLVCLMATA